MPDTLPTPYDLVELGFLLTRQGPGIQYWGGHRLRIELSTKHIRIVVQGCGCPLVQCPQGQYSRARLEALIEGMKQTQIPAEA